MIYPRYCRQLCHHLELTETTESSRRGLSWSLLVEGWKGGDMSGEVGASQIKEDRKALEAFVRGNYDLEHLESLLYRFNIFEATGFIRQELRHSDFLAFLLNPQGSHSLRDAFVKRLLKRVLASGGIPPTRDIDGTGAVGSCTGGGPEGVAVHRHTSSRPRPQTGGHYREQDRLW